MAVGPSSWEEPRGVRRKVSLARSGLVWELLWPRLVPLLGIVGLFLAAAHLDLFAGLEPWTHTAILVALALGLIGAVWWLFRRVHWPDRDNAARRLESDSGVPHRPLAAMQDTMAVGGNDPFATALWEAHRKREAERLAALHNRPPRPGVPAMDVRALRLVPLLLLVVAVVAAGGWRSDRLLTAISPAFPPPPPLVVELWVSPPAYTRKPPIYLDAKEPADGKQPVKVLRVPAGSKIAGFVDNVPGSRAPLLMIDDREVPFTSVSGAKYQIEATLDKGERLVVMVRGRERASWVIKLQADLPPTVEFMRDPVATERRETRIEYIAADDFGVAAVSARMRLHGTALTGLVGDEDPTWVTLELPLAGVGRTRVEDFLRQDLTPHPWAGLSVVMELVATDGAGQEGRSKAVQFTLPERRFSHPVARRIITLRKSLSQDPKGNRVLAGQGLLLLNSRPNDYKGDVVVHLGLRTAANRLATDKSGETIPDVQKLMWDLAVRLESDSLTDAQREFRDAQRELKDALDRGAPDPEIERLIQQLREAMDRMMREFAERMKDPAEREKAEREAQEMDPDRMMNSEDLQSMMDRAREMARNGQREEAKRMLEQMLKDMENMKPMLSDRQQGQRGQQGQQQQGRQMMNELDQMARQQNRLLGESERQQRGQQQGRQQGQQGQQGRQPGQQGQQPGQQQGQQRGQGRQPGQQGSPGDQLGDQQGNLRGRLGDFMGRFGDQPGDVPGSLGQSERAMRDAEDALRRGDYEGAARAQRRALDHLQQGMQDMAERMQRGPGNQQDRGEVQERQQADKRDPFGRSEGNYGDAIDTDDTKVPDRLERQRSREILDELRRRAGEPERPKPELDYIDRLLRQF